MNEFFNKITSAGLLNAKKLMIEGLLILERDEYKKILPCKKPTYKWDDPYVFLRYG